MKHWTIIALFPLAASLGLARTCHADEFNRVLTDQSTLTFSFKQMGVGLEGYFKKFAASLNFDPDRIDSARASVNVSNLASIDTGYSEGDDEVAGKSWTFQYQGVPLRTLCIQPLQVTGRWPFRSGRPADHQGAHPARDPNRHIDSPGQ